MTLPYWIINFGVWVKGAPERLRLELASRNPKRSSARTLRRILKANKDTVYGREHHFGLILRAKDPDRLSASTKNVYRRTSMRPSGLTWTGIRRENRMCLSRVNL